MLPEIIYTTKKKKCSVADDQILPFTTSDLESSSGNKLVEVDILDTLQSPLELPEHQESPLKKLKFEAFQV